MVEMWWLSGGDVVAQCMVDIWRLNGGDAGAQWWLNGEDVEILHNKL